MPCDSDYAFWLGSLRWLRDASGKRVTLKQSLRPCGAKYWLVPAV